MEARHSNRFRVSVSTEPHSVVMFYLMYEELLARKGGHYEYLVNISPMTRLKHFSVGVTITEQLNITMIAVPRLKTIQVEDRDSVGGTLEGAEIMMSPTTPGKVTVSYNPNIKKLQHRLRSVKHPLQVILSAEYCAASDKLL